MQVFRTATWTRTFKEDPTACGKPARLTEVWADWGGGGMVMAHGVVIKFRMMDRLSLWVVLCGRNVEACEHVIYAAGDNATLVPSWHALNVPLG